MLAVNLAGAPARTGGEGTIVSRVWAAQHLSRLAPAPYLYDQPPLGWLQVSVWTRLTGAFGAAPTAVAAGRSTMVLAFAASAGLLWLLARRLGLARWSAALAVVTFGLSPSPWPCTARCHSRTWRFPGSWPPSCWPPAPAAGSAP